MMPPLFRYASQRPNFVVGFSLVETMIALAVVSILATITILSYRSFAIKKDMSNGQQYLSELQQKQELFYQNQRRYANNIEELGITSARPKGSESSFADIKLFVLTRDEAGRNYYSAVLDPVNDNYPPMVVSEGGQRYYEYTKECYEHAGVGTSKTNSNPATMSFYERFGAVAYCRFSDGDIRWDENTKVASQSPRRAAEVASASPSGNPSAVITDKLLNIFRVLPPGATPSNAKNALLATPPEAPPACDSEAKNTQIPAGTYRNVVANNIINVCSCHKNSASIAVNGDGSVNCVQYTGCGSSPGTYTQATSSASCTTIHRCDAASNTLHGAVDANIKTDVIYADPAGTGENGYRVWCSGSGILNINYLDPTQSTCYGAKCNSDGVIAVDTTNNLAQYEITFNCQTETVGAYPSSVQNVTKPNGDQYRVSCPNGTLMNFNSTDFYQSTCTKFVCSGGATGLGDQIPATTN